MEATDANCCYYEDVAFNSTLEPNMVQLAFAPGVYRQVHGILDLPNSALVVLERKELSVTTVRLSVNLHACLIEALVHVSLELAVASEDVYNKGVERSLESTSQITTTIQHLGAAPHLVQRAL